MSSPNPAQGLFGVCWGRLGSIGARSGFDRSLFGVYRGSVRGQSRFLGVLLGSVLVGGGLKLFTYGVLRFPEVC